MIDILLTSLKFYKYICPQKNTALRVLYKKIDTPFEYPFTISGGRTKSSQPALVVGLNLGNYIGWGEAPAITYYNVTVESMIEELESKKEVIEKFALTDPERFWHFLHHLFPNNPFLVCALDIAGWDLFGKLDKQPVYKIWDLEWKNTPLTDYTIGIDTPEKMLEKLSQHPWPIYKIKLGTEDDIAILKEIRKVTSSPIRIDANAGWTLEKALNILPELEQLNIELIEQPLAKDNWEDMKILKAKSNIPLIADESCVSEHDVLKCAPYFHGINIKLTKCSGMTPAKRMVQEARSLGLKVMMGSMNETNIGSAAIAQFLPMLDYVDMDGPLLLKEYDMEGLDIKEGVVTLSGGNGLGIRKKK